MPFINGGGLFVPSQEAFSLGESVIVDLQLPGKVDPLRIEGKVVWITPKIALYHVIAGIGIQFSESNSKTICNQIESQLNATVEIGGYTYGVTDSSNKDK